MCDKYGYVLHTGIHFHAASFCLCWYTYARNYLKMTHHARQQFRGSFLVATFGIVVVDKNQQKQVEETLQTLTPKKTCWFDFRVSSTHVWVHAKLSNFLSVFAMHNRTPGVIVEEPQPCTLWFPRTVPLGGEEEVQTICGAPQFFDDGHCRPRCGRSGCGCIHRPIIAHSWSSHPRFHTSSQTHF